MSTIESLQQQINSLATQVSAVENKVSEMSRPPVSRATHVVMDGFPGFHSDPDPISFRALGGPVNTAEPGKRIPMAFSDPEMQRAYDAGEPFKTPDERRIEELEAIIERARPVAVVHSMSIAHGVGLEATVLASAVIEGLLRPGDKLYAVPVDQSKRIEELERALAGMLFEFDDGVNGGHRESPDEHVAALDYARTLVKAEEFKA